ncbi:hypothetical protein MAR_029288 [Mya arenaria]|uniref:Uncharacterized protein n=1 Tax=Mya arenaria TaxID=6604 RepID=A0ABY7DKH9_MYAAR|nr:hypothetical protein MAR_029288 [Mya arenaria]
MYAALSTLNTTDQPPALKDLLSSIGITEQEYNPVLTVSVRRTHVVMMRKPSDIFVNNYNPTILRCLKSNMDIQIITSMWACIAYISSYICKPEKNYVRIDAKEANDNNIREKLFSIANILRKGREVSHHEAVMKV